MTNKQITAYVCVPAEYNLESQFSFFNSILKGYFTLTRKETRAKVRTYPGDNNPDDGKMYRIILEEVENTDD